MDAEKLTDGEKKEGDDHVGRRMLLKLAGAAAGVGALSWAIAPFVKFGSRLSAEEVFQQHYKELTAEDKKTIFRRLEAETLRDYGARVTIDDPPQIPATKWGYALNLSVCMGCRQCAKACHEENNHDRASNNSYIRVFEMGKESLDLANATSEYQHPVPQPGKTYMPVQCNHCDKPPCVNVCPVRATWKEADGPVVIDYNWCIGCRYCEAACPYHARRFNWTRPEIEADEVNPRQSYLSNRIRPQGAMEKCTFCLHRVRKGQLPACLESCPAGARVFGNLRDPESEICWVIENKRVFVLKEEQGTVPSFYYFTA